MTTEIEAIRGRYLSAYRQAFLDGLENTQRCADLDTLFKEIDRLEGEVGREHDAAATNWDYAQQLEGEVERLKATNKEYGERIERLVFLLKFAADPNELDTLRRANERLVEALEPFAKVRNRHYRRGCNMPDGAPYPKMSDTVAVECWIKKAELEAVQQASEERT